MFVSVSLPPRHTHPAQPTETHTLFLRRCWGGSGGGGPRARSEGPRGPGGGPTAVPPGAVGRLRGVGRAAAPAASSEVAPEPTRFFSESSDGSEAPGCALGVLPRRRGMGSGTRAGKARGTRTERAVSLHRILPARPRSLPKPRLPPPPNPHPPTLRARVVKGKGKAIAPKERRGKGGNTCPNELVSTLQASFDK